MWSEGSQARGDTLKTLGRDEPRVSEQIPAANRGEVSGGAAEGFGAGLPQDPSLTP